MTQQNKEIEIDQDNLAFSTIRLFFLSIRKQPLGTIIIFAGFIWTVRLLFSLIWFTFISSIPSPGINNIFNPIQIGWFIGSTSQSFFKNIDEELTYTVIEASGYDIQQLDSALKVRDQRRRTVIRQVSTYGNQNR